MEQLRKLHNKCKRDLISKWVPAHSRVLDCGCGRGGDLQKWNAVKARVDAIDPDASSIQEAQKRAKQMGLDVRFLGVGDIRQAVKVMKEPWDVICYNFSLQYIFSDFNESILGISRALKPGGLLIGIAPEKFRIETMCHPSGIFKDSLGNIIENFSDHARVKLVDGPFYGGEFKTEPVMDGEFLILELLKLKITLISWEPMILNPTGMISDMYTKFVFRNNMNVVPNIDFDSMDNLHA